jgi:two-component system response regulator DevR
MIKIVVIEDESFWQQAICRTLMEHGLFEVTGVISTVVQARQAIEQIEADLIILDVSLGMHPQGGVELAYEWKHKQLNIPPIFMLTSHEDPAFISECFAAGATNYLCKRDLTRLCLEIENVLSGRMGMVSYVAHALRTDYLRLREISDREQLTPMERTILYYVHQGVPQSRIADIICISPRTIKNHVNSILRKMNVKSSKEAALRAELRGWLKSDNLL